MRFLVFLFPLLLASCSTVKFNPARPIEEGYRQGGERLDRDDLLSTLAQLPGSDGPAHRAIVERDWSLGLGLPGGLVFGYEIGRALGGGDPNWAVFGAGAAVWSAGLALAILSDASLREASNIYNDRLSVHAFIAPAGEGGFAGVRIAY